MLLTAGVFVAMATAGIFVAMVRAGVFVAMAFANSPLLIRHWIRLQAQPTPRCVVPYHLVLSRAVWYHITSFVCAP